MRKAAGIVVDRGAAWLAVDADGQLAAIYSKQIGGDDEDGYADRFSSLHEALGMPDSVGRLVGKVRPDGDPDGAVEIYIVKADEFDANRAALTMTKIASEQIREAVETHRVTDAVSLVALQSVLLQRAPASVYPPAARTGEGPRRPAPPAAPRPNVGSMDPAELGSLLEHLQAQAITLNTTVEQAAAAPADAQLLVDVRDQIFCIQETLGTLGVPHALLSRDEWSRLPRP